MTTFLTEVRGFTPLIDALVAELSLNHAVIYGVVWRFCQMDDRVCRASIATLAGLIGLHRTTVMRYLKDLADRGYLQDLTPNRSGSPHLYADTGKAKIIGLVDARVEGVQRTTGWETSAEPVAQRTPPVAQRTPPVAQRTPPVAQRTPPVAECDTKRVLKRVLKREPKKEVLREPEPNDLERLVHLFHIEVTGRFVKGMAIQPALKRAVADAIGHFGAEWLEKAILFTGQQALGLRSWSTLIRELRRMEVEASQLKLEGANAV